MGREEGSTEDMITDRKPTYAIELKESGDTLGLFKADTAEEAWNEFVAMGEFTGSHEEFREQVDITEVEYSHTPDECPSDHYNDGSDICSDCGEDLQDPGDGTCESCGLHVQNAHTALREVPKLKELVAKLEGELRKLRRQPS